MTAQAEQQIIDYTEFDQPTISVDRALGHFVTDINIDMPSLMAYYDALPHPEKPPLSDLHIHLSSTPSLSSEHIRLGSYLSGGTQSSKANNTPELPRTQKPTIIMYIGTELLYALNNKEDERNLDDRLDNSVTHELAHFAQDNTDLPELPNYPLSDRLKNHLIIFSSGALINAIDDRRWAGTGLAAFVSSQLFADTGVFNSLKIAAGAATLVHASGTPVRRKAEKQRQHEAYREEDKEVDAQNHEDPQAGIITLQRLPPTGKHKQELLDIKVPYPKQGKRFRRYIANQAHERLALEPRAR